MWSLDGQCLRAACRGYRRVRLVSACFQPLYGELSPTSQPVLREQLSAVNVLQIEAPKGTDEARLAVEVRNDLLFDFTGGEAAAPPVHKPEDRDQLHTHRHHRRHQHLAARHRELRYHRQLLAHRDRNRQIVVTGQTFARVSYDIPGQQQRFARLRGLRDAEYRAAKVIADNIRNRLASYFIAGT